MWSDQWAHKFKHLLSLVQVLLLTKHFRSNNRSRWELVLKHTKMSEIVHKIALYSSRRLFQLQKPRDPNLIGKTHFLHPGRVDELVPTLQMWCSLTLLAYSEDFSLKRGVNNIFSSHCGIFQLLETWILLGEPYGDISNISCFFQKKKKKSPSTSVV